MKNVLFVCLFIFGASGANAAVLSYTGNFDDDEVRFYTTFDVTSASTVNLTSWGYAGGTNGAGDIITDGGFDSQLALFNSSGSLVANNDDGSSIISSSSGLAWDALLSLVLAVDSYTAVLTQFDSDYVSGDLVTGVWTTTGVSGFVDVDGNQRTSAYAFDISGDFIANVGAFNTNASPVPAPGSLALLALGLVGLGYSRKKKMA